MSRPFPHNFWSHLSDLPYKVRDFCRDIRAVLRWIPRIWGTREWDHYFLFQILEWKLSDMEAFYRSGRTVSSHAARTARDIMVAKNLCRRIRLDDYSSPWDTWFGEALDTGELLRFDKWPKGTVAKMKRHSKHEEAMKHQDLALLTKIIRTKVLTWWD